MNSGNSENYKHENPGEIRNIDLVKRIEDTYRVYRLSEVFLNDVEKDYGKDYGKIKIARLRLEFARHELMETLKEAMEKGIKWNENEYIKKFFYPNSYKSDTNDFLV
jgi:hypothetical protein